MDVTLEPVESNVSVSLEDDIVERRPSEEFEETIARVRQSILQYPQSRWTPLQWVPATRPDLSVHPVLMKLYDMAWNAHAAREELVLTAFASTLDMKVRNTQALGVYAHALQLSAKQLLSTLSRANTTYMHTEWKTKWATTLKTAQADLHTTECDPHALMEMCAAQHLGTIHCDSDGADLVALRGIAPTFQTMHGLLHLQWKGEMERHAATLAGKLSKEGLAISLPVYEKVETTMKPPISSGKEWVDTLRACHLDFSLRLQTLDAVDTALEETLQISTEIARAVLDITRKEDASFRAAKAVVNASIATVDDTIVHVEKELARAYNQTTEYKRHLVLMRSTIETNLDAQREALYRNAVAMV